MINLVSEIAISVLIVELGQSFTTPFSIDLDPGTYTLRATYNTQTQEKTATVTAGLTTVVDFTFVPITFTLTINTTTGGTTNPTPGAYIYNSGETAQVTAIPNSGYVFDHWTLDGVTRTGNPISVTMNANHTLVAYFTQVQPPLTYTLTITSTTGGSTNPSPGIRSYNEGTIVSVLATPSTGYRFVNWELDGAPRTANPIEVLMSTNHTLRAIFELIPSYTLTINTTTGGTTSPVPSTYSYQENATVKVTAVPNSGYNFDHWTLDGINYTTNPITIIMSANHVLTAYFSEVPPLPPETHVLAITTTEGGTTNPESGIYEVDVGTVIRVAAIAFDGYKFKRFELDGEPRLENPLNVIMDADHTLLAIFEPIPPPISMSMVGAGVATAVGAGVAIGYLARRGKK